MKPQSSMSPTARFRVVTAVALTALLIPLAGAPAGAQGPASPGEPAPRNLDLRPVPEAPVGPAGRQLSALEELRAAMPGLLVTFDPSSGVTRSLFNPDGALTGHQEGTPEELAFAFLDSHRTALGLGPADLRDLEVTDRVDSRITGVTHLYLGQQHVGLPIYNAQLQVHVASDGRILSVNNAFLPDLGSRGTSIAPGLGAQNAVIRAAESLGIEVSGPPPAVLERAGGLAQRTVIDGDGISLEPVETELMWLPVGSELQLVWNLQLQTLDRQHWFDMTVDATSGQVWTRFDWVTDATYRVYPQPTESPIHTSPLPPSDARILLTDPHLDAPIASPDGWHQVGTTGFTITRGNNVHAFEDRDGDNSPPSTEVDCGGSLACDFPIDLSQEPIAYIPAAVTNLFYWNNIIHDIQYQYGFDEVAGNFQEDNFGRGASGSDSVSAHAQDANDAIFFPGNCNANFATPADGSNPRMQMFLCDADTPERDGDLDAGVIVHEYGHGITNRQVGGPSNVSCLGNTQQPGEGWSDWFALAYTAETGDLGTDPRGVGSYLFALAPDGTIRPQQYSTDPAINDYTYESISGLSVPHGVGSVWAQAIWEVYWTLVDTHGFDPDLYNAFGGAGNQRAMLYINEGLKFTACSPSFLDTRNGVIQAAQNLFGGEDECRVWQAFADFGLGSDATTGGADTQDATNGFTNPLAPCDEPTCVPPAAPTNLVASTPADNTIALTWDAVTGATSYEVARSTTSGGPYTPIATVTVTNFTDTGLAAGETFFYVVRAIDENQSATCISADSNEASATVTGTTPTCTDQTLYTNSFEGESGLSDWSVGSFNGGSTADWAGVQNCGGASGSNIFRFGGNNCNKKYGSDNFNFAQPNGSGGVAVPAGSETVRLTFNHSFGFRSGEDGATLRVSLDGVGYTDVPASAILGGASYNGTISSSCAPAGTNGSDVFTGSQGSFVSTEVDLDAVCDLITGGTSGCAGQSVRVGFTGITDCRRGDSGWFLDDVTVTACVP